MTLTNKSPTVKRGDLYIYGFLIAIILFLSWEIINLKGKKTLQGNSNQESELMMTYFGKTIPQFSLKSIDDNNLYTFIPHKNNLYHLFIFFSPLDCNSCFDETPFWKDIENKFKSTLRTIAVGTAKSKEILAHFVAKNNISVLTLYDENEFLFNNLELKYSSITPVKILTNNSGIILHINMTTKKNEKKQHNYLELLSKIIPKN